jgi:hypothetical protein
MKKNINFFVAFAMAFSLLATISLAQTTTTTQSATCSISLGLTFDFGNVAAGGISDERSVSITNDGDIATNDISISGDAWNGPSFFDVSATHFSTTQGQLYGDMSFLGTGSPLPDLQPSEPETVYFKVQIPNHQTFGTYSQTITFTVSC